jgi:hypothetical protein
MSFFKNKGQENKTDFVRGLLPVEEVGEEVKKGEYGRNIMYTCLKMEK